jgi:hypothetical protein
MRLFNPRRLAGMDHRPLCPPLDRRHVPGEIVLGTDRPIASSPIVTNAKNVNDATHGRISHDSGITIAQNFVACSLRVSRKSANGR